jgi:hypothetical protein
MPDVMPANNDDSKETQFTTFVDTMTQNKTQKNLNGTETCTQKTLFVHVLVFTTLKTSLFIALR